MKTKNLCMVFLLYCNVCVAEYTQTFYIDSNQVVVDMAGRRIPTHTPFKRIISLYGAHTENLQYLGLDSAIIGISRNDAYPEMGNGKKVLSAQEDPEKFLVEKPDLILIRPMLDRGYRKLFSVLEKQGVTVVSLQPKNVTDIYLYWRILGLLTGKENESGRMVETFKTAVNEFTTLTADIPHKSLIYFEAIHKKMKTFTKGAMADFVLTCAGGINVAVDGKSSRGTNIAIYSREKILSKASQIDVFISQYGSMNRVTRDEILNEPGFHLIKAIQNNRILIVDETIVSRPTMGLLKGIAEIGAYLYPAIFQEKSPIILQKAQLP